MAEEVEMTPVEAGEPPKADPLAKPASPVSAAAQAAPAIHKPVVGAAPSAGGLKPGLKLPTQNALKPGLKLPTQNALKPGVRLPQKPVIRKPGSTVIGAPLPKPVSAAKPVAVDAQGVGKLPTVEAKAVSRDDATPVVTENPKPLEALKSVTQKLKGITQEIPQQAILRKTGIIADGAMSDAQKEAAKHKTARISLSDAMGVAPVKNENAPIKTIRIKRPVDIPGSTKPLKPQPPPAAATEPASAAAETAGQDAAAPTATQRKTMKITRPGGGAVRPSGKFSIKRPGSAPASATASAAGESGGGAVADIPEISDMPDIPVAPVPVRVEVSDGPAWLWTLSAIVQLAACAVVGALAWFLYTNTATSYF